MNSDYSSYFQHQQRERALVRDVERRRVGLARAGAPIRRNRFAVLRAMGRRVRALTVRRAGGLAADQHITG
jgi:hypothetical protein